MVFDEKLGKPVPWKPTTTTYQEFVRNPGQLEVTPKKEAEKNPDQQIMTEMVEQGFFLLAWKSFVIDGTL